MWVLIVLLSCSTCPPMSCLVGQSRTPERFSDIEGMYERRPGKHGVKAVCLLVSRLEKTQKMA